MEEKIKKENKKSETALREEKVLEFWRENKIFEKSVSQNEGKKEFIFYEGPPTANGMPGIHHLEARAFKDAIPRYKTMRGYHVRRKGGWDTHGLPVELQVEKKLGLNSKKAIEEYGIAKFNQECKESVWEHLDVWNKFTKRIGYWLDQENPYVTYHNDYIESVWNVVKKINEQNLLYKDYKVVPWCPRCGTALSSHELAQGYEEVTDLSVTVRFELMDEPDTIVLAWTTTPWTLPGNTALAVNKDLDYVKIKRFQTAESLSRPMAKIYQELYYIVSRKFFESNFILLNGDDINLPSKERTYIRPEYVVEADNLFKIVDEFKGSKLVGKSYKPIFNYFTNISLENKKNIWKIWHADFVVDDTGTGIAHEAPAFGVDDMQLAKKHNIPIIKHVNSDGSFVSEVEDFKGMIVKKKDDNTSTDIEIIRWLAYNHKLFAKGKIVHSYPHCWRCKTALIYYARDSWYIRMSDLKIKQQLIDENKEINWEPSYIREGRFGEWLREIKDWAISRERYWGTPLPVWQCSSCKKFDVIGSIADLKEKTKKSGNKYFIMRHGESESNVIHAVSCVIGNKDFLTEKGKNQAQESALKLKNKKIDLIITSPLERCTQTAEIMAGIIGLEKKHILKDERIIEVQAISSMGKTWEERDSQFKSRKEFFVKEIEGDENLMTVKKRMGEFLYDLESKYKNQNILIISHGSPMSLIPEIKDGLNLEQILKADFRGVLKNAEIKEFDFMHLPHNENHELDLHKPYIDEISLKCECDGELKRVREVMDVWFDSGAMPFAQDHYPLEFEKTWYGKRAQEILYPADYICEAIDQTRGWFYTLHAIGVLTGRGKAYKNVICLGHLLDSRGKKMSKSLGNVVDPWVMMDKYGVDTLRLWMYSVNQPGESKNFDEKTVVLLHSQVFGLLYNVLAFFELYKDIDKPDDAIDAYEGEVNVLDRWILLLDSELNDSITKNLDEYKLLEPVRAIREYINIVSTWYLRRSRERIKGGDKDAVRTLRLTLRRISIILAPLAPFVAEDVYQRVRWEDDPISVHLETWQEPIAVDMIPANIKMLEDMKYTREIVSKSLEARQKAGIKVRQPLRELRIKNYELGIEYTELIKDELNVKEVVQYKNIENEVELDTNITAELKQEGNYRELVRAVQDMRKKMGLTPSDIILITFETSEAGKKLIQKFENDMKKTVLISGLEFESNDGEEIKIDELTLKVKIDKMKL